MVLPFQNINNKKGFTIIELLVSLTILLMVISIGYGFYHYINRSFTVASKQSSVQQNVRLAKDMIENKIRQASEIKILTETGNPPEGNNYNSIYLSEGKIIIEENGNPRDLLNGLSDGIAMDLFFKMNRESFIEVTVTGDPGGNNEYYISSEIMYLKKYDNILGDKGNTIYFISP